MCLSNNASKKNYLDLSSFVKRSNLPLGNGVIFLLSTLQWGNDISPVSRALLG